MNKIGNIIGATLIAIGIIISLVVTFYTLFKLNWIYGVALTGFMFIVIGWIILSINNLNENEEEEENE